MLQSLNQAMADPFKDRVGCTGPINNDNAVALPFGELEVAKANFLVKVQSLGFKPTHLRVVQCFTRSRPAQSDRNRNVEENRQVGPRKAKIACQAVGPLNSESTGVSLIG